jgi:predicted peroxiredoxin
MAEPASELVVVITHGADHELSSLAFTIANGGITSGLKVSIFLTSNGVDLVRKRAIDNLVVHPLEPLAALVKDFVACGPVRPASRRVATSRRISSTALRSPAPA